ncbi:MAG: HD domain-containing phosphohydrolase [Calditrichia bacterium]
MDTGKQFSNNERLNRLLNNVVQEVQAFAETQISRIQRLTEIGIALSAEKDINKLLDMIVDEAMNITNADAGTLYIVDNDFDNLRFEILKNRTLNTSIGGTSGTEINLPPVPLRIDGEENHANVSSYAALTGEMVNIADVYEAEGFDFSGPMDYDRQSGYRSTSMLVIPMKNHDGEIIGVLQLLNAQNFETGEVIPFGGENVNLIISLASQAAIALENAELIYSLKELFEAFIKSIATAIDEKSPYTGGHIRRVTELTMMIAARVNDISDGPFAEIRLSPEEMEELRIAAWMHDVGKITTPEHIIHKSHKLEGIFDRIDVVMTRFDLIKQIKHSEYLEEKMVILERSGGMTEELEELEDRHREIISMLEMEKNFIVKCNTGTETMSSEQSELLKEISHKTFSHEGEEKRFLTDDELYHLSIQKGTLTAEERKIIENHALVSIKILSQLPFPKKLARVADYAGGHHEKLDGSGYPFGLTAEQLPLQARIMALADIFEALTAKDRPYKEPMPLSRAIGILDHMCKSNHIDENLYRLFIDSGIVLDYAERELTNKQIDVQLEKSA